MSGSSDNGGRATLAEVLFEGYQKRDDVRLIVLHIPDERHRPLAQKIIDERSDGTVDTIIDDTNDPTLYSGYWLGEGQIVLMVCDPSL